jgi:hypothetical protein
VFHEPVILVPGEMLDVREVPGNQVIDRDHLVPLGEEAIRQMRTKKTGATGHD